MPRVVVRADHDRLVRMGRAAPHADHVARDRVLAAGRDLQLRRERATGERRAQRRAVARADRDGRDRRRAELRESHGALLDQVVGRAGDVEHRRAAARDRLVELRRAVERLVARDHHDLAGDVLAGIVGGAADADVDDLRTHASRGAVGEALGRNVRPADGQARALLAEQRYVELLARGRETRGAEGAFEPARLFAARGAAGRAWRRAARTRASRRRRRRPCQSCRRAPRRGRASAAASAARRPIVERFMAPSDASGPPARPGHPPTRACDHPNGLSLQANGPSRRRHLRSRRARPRPARARQCPRRRRRRRRERHDGERTGRHREVRARRRRAGRRAPLRADRAERPEQASWSTTSRSAWCASCSNERSRRARRGERC